MHLLFFKRHCFSRNRMVIKIFRIHWNSTSHRAALWQPSLNQHRVEMFNGVNCRSRFAGRTQLNQRQLLSGRGLTELLQFYSGQRDRLKCASRETLGQDRVSAPGLLSMRHIYLQLSLRWRVTNACLTEESDREYGSFLFLL